MTKTRHWRRERNERMPGWGAAGDEALSAITKAMRMLDLSRVDEIVSGGALGVDRAGEHWADNMYIRKRVFSADWEKHGKAAGPIRNREMADYADFAVVVWDGQSRGSANMLDEMRRAAKPALSWVVR